MNPVLFYFWIRKWISKTNIKNTYIFHTNLIPHKKIIISETHFFEIQNLLSKQRFSNWKLPKTKTKKLTRVKSLNRSGTRAPVSAERGGRRLRLHSWKPWVRGECYPWRCPIPLRSHIVPPCFLNNFQLFDALEFRRSVQRGEASEAAWNNSYLCRNIASEGWPLIKRSTDDFAVWFSTAPMRWRNKRLRKNTKILEGDSDVQVSRDPTWNS